MSQFNAQLDSEKSRHFTDALSNINQSRSTGQINKMDWEQIVSTSHDEDTISIYGDVEEDPFQDDRTC